MKWGARRRLRRGAPVSWISGAAGGGKTVIQREIVDQCKSKGIFGGAWFFSTRAAVTKLDNLVATLACQLADRSPKLRTYIEESLENDSSLLDKSLEVQFDQLIRLPIMRYSYDSTGHKPPSTSGLLWPAHSWWKCYISRIEWFMFVIDGLDECEDPKEQLQLLRVIESFTRDEYLPIRFCIASRPEYDIRCQFGRPPLTTSTYQVKLDDYVCGDGDIRTYLVDELSRIKRTHPGRAGFPRDWPSPEDVERLVDRASKQFIYAATVIKFVDNRQTPPVALLKLVLDLPRSQESSNPLADLDELYSAILFRVNVDLETLRTVLHLIMIHPQEYSSTSDIDTFLLLEPGTTGLLLADLHSLIHVPDDVQTPDTRDKCVHFYHKSLEDFLTTQHRSGELYQPREVTQSIIQRHSSGSAVASLIRLSLHNACVSGAGEAGTIPDVAHLKTLGPKAETVVPVYQEVVTDLLVHGQESPLVLARAVVMLVPPSTDFNPPDLDNLYCAILHRARVDASELKHVLVQLRDRPAQFATLLEVDDFLGFEPGVSEHLLRDLRCLVHVPAQPPPTGDDADHFVRIRRDDFKDFLSRLYRMADNTPDFFV